MKALVNVKTYDFVEYIDDGYIIFDKKIIEVGHMKDMKHPCERIDGKGRLLIPGLINFHTHIYSTLFRGLDMKAYPESFRDVLDEIWWKFDSFLKLEDIGLSAGVYCMESLKSGVTSIVDHHASGEISGSLDVLRNVVKGHFGIKALFCFETSDRFDIDQCIKENIQAMEMGDGIFGLHAQMSLSEDSLSKCSIYAGDTPIHIHAAESMEDEKDCHEKYGMSVIERLDKHALLNRNSILAHCTNINEIEGEIIGERECITALNPSSNMNNAVGLFDYDIFRNNAINLVVGTDGLGTNIGKEWQSLYFNGKQGLGNPSGIGLDEIRYHIAKSYELFNELAFKKIGRFKNGYDADFILIDYMPPTPLNGDNAFGHIFYGVFDNLRPSDVFIEGDRKIMDYELQIKFDINQDVSRRLWKRIEG